MVGGLAEFSDLFLNIEAVRGRERTEAEALLALVPATLREAPCFLDRLTKVWLYDFGEAVSTARGNVTGVGLTFHSLARLADVVACARSRLRQSELDNYLARFADPKKHADMLFEFAPILLLDSSTSAEYEVVGRSPRNRRIDWWIQGADGFGLLLEVKNRAADLFRGFERIQAGERDADGRAPAPDHDTDLLFKSVGSKFLPRPPTQVPQGVWVASGLMQEESELERSFLRLDPAKVHFAILGSWGPAAHLLARDDVPRDRIVRLLGLEEVEGLVFSRPPLG